MRFAPTTGLERFCRSQAMMIPVRLAHRGRRAMMMRRGAFKFASLGVLFLVGDSMRRAGVRHDQ